jgi:hypothetical protein
MSCRMCPVDLLTVQLYQEAWQAATAQEQTAGLHVANHNSCFIGSANGTHGVCICVNYNWVVAGAAAIAHAQQAAAAAAAAAAQAQDAQDAANTSHDPTGMEMAADCAEQSCREVVQPTGRVTAIAMVVPVVPGQAWTEPVDPRRRENADPLRGRGNSQIGQRREAPTGPM